MFVDSLDPPRAWEAVVTSISIRHSGCCYLEEASVSSSHTPFDRLVLTMQPWPIENAAMMVKERIARAVFWGITCKR